MSGFPGREEMMAFRFAIYSTIPISPSSVVEAIEKTADDYHHPENWAIGNRFEALIGRPVFEILIHHKGPDNPFSPDYFAVIDNDNWKEDGGLLLVAVEHFGGTIDAIRTHLTDPNLKDVEVTIANLEISNLDWEEFLYEDPPLAALYCVDFPHTGPAFDRLKHAVDAGIKRRRENFLELCREAGSSSSIANVLLQHKQVAESLNCQQLSFIVADRTTAENNAVLIIQIDENGEEKDRQRVPASLSGEALRWLHIGFCKWGEWVELLNAKAELDFENDDEKMRSHLFPIYAIVEIYLPGLICILRRTADGSSDTEGRDFYRPARDFDSFVGKTTTDVVRHFRGDRNIYNDTLFILATESVRQWSPDDPVVIVKANHKGAIDAVKMPVGKASGSICAIHKTDSRFSDSLVHEEGVPAALCSVSALSDQSALSELEHTINAGINKRRSEDMPDICHLFPTRMNLQEAIRRHSKIAENSKCDAAAFIVAGEPTAKDGTVLVVKVADGQMKDSRRVPASYSGEALRWVRLGFCKWGEWEELVDVDWSGNDQGIAEACPPVPEEPYRKEPGPDESGPRGRHYKMASGSTPAMPPDPVLQPGEFLTAFQTSETRIAEQVSKIKAEFESSGKILDGDPMEYMTEEDWENTVEEVVDEVLYEVHPGGDRKCS